MLKLSFNIVDVFSERKYSGNQLAVFRGLKKLLDYEMQEIAKEMNFSETTFILSEKEVNGGFDVRIFTPRQEVAFAGHPTLGTAYIIQKEILKKPVKKIFLNLKVGQIPVSFRYKNNKIQELWMRQIEPIFGEILSSELIAPILSLDVDDIDDNFPIQQVSTGLPFIIVPIKNLKAIKKCKIIKNLYFDMIKNTEAKAIFVFTKETYSKRNHINSRMFADFLGIVEDPATGSANGCLAGYLIKYNYFNKESINIRVEQGFEIGRPSILLLKAKKNKDRIEVYVGGTVHMIAFGEFTE